MPDDGTESSEWESIPTQGIPDAIRTCKRSVEADRLADAAREARSRDLISDKDMSELLDELKGWVHG